MARRRPIGLFRPDGKNNSAIADRIARDVVAEAGTFPTDVSNDLLAEIVNGTPKERSRFKDRPGFDEKWDALSAQVNDIQGVVEIPNEMP